MRHIQSIALIMMYLTISLIFAVPMSAQIYDVNIHGEDNIQGYRRGNDITAIDVRSDNTTSLRTSDSLLPLTCTMNGSNSTYVCSHTFDMSEVANGEHTITLKENSPFSIDKQYTFVVDDIAPEIAYNLSYDKENIIITYNLVDKSDVLGNVGVGLKSFTLTTDSETVFEKEFNNSPKTDSNVITTSGKNLVGNITFYFSATDKLNNFKQGDIKNMIVDFKAPIIEEDVKFMAGDEEIDMISTRPEFSPVTRFVFVIQEDNLQNVTVDLSDATRNPNQIEQYKHMDAQCGIFGLKNTCIVSNIMLNPGKQKINIPIAAQDTFGNTVTTNITKVFQLAETQAGINYFNPLEEHCDEENCYVKKGVNLVKLSITKADSDIIPQFINIHVGDVSTIDRLRPTLCNETDANTVDCLIHLPVSGNMHGQRKKILVTRPTTDKAGIPLNGIEESFFIVDEKKPVNITEINFTQEGFNSDKICPTASETAQLAIKVTDDTSSNVKITAKPVNITGLEEFTSWCTPLSNNEFDCKLQLDNFVSMYAKENVLIEIEDLAGNVLQLHKEIEVCEAQSNVAPELISKITVDSSNLQKIDRRTLSIIPIKTYIPFNVHKKQENKGIEILAMRTDGCLGTEFLANGANSYIIEDSLDNKGILVTEIGGRLEPYNETININCTISFYLRDTHTRYIIPEQETITADLEAYNNPLGTLDDGISEKLDNLKGEIKDLQGIIDTEKTINGFAKLSCNMLKTMNLLNSVISALETFLYGISVVLYAIPITSAAGKGLWSFSCPLALTVHEYYAKIMSPWYQQILQGFCFLYECSLCKMSTYSSLGAEVGSTVGQMNTAKGGFLNPEETESPYVQSYKNYLDQLDNANINYNFETKSFFSEIEIYKDSENNELKEGHTGQMGQYLQRQSEESRQLADADFLINPYKSHYVAWACTCLPAVIYTNEMQKQIKCRAYKCIDEKSKLGLPIDSCDMEYDVGTCLYYEGAISHSNGGMIAFDLIASSVSAMALGFVQAWLYEATCGSTRSDSCGTPAMGWWAISCNVLQIYTSSQQLASIFSHDPFDQKEYDGKNYCEGIE